MGTNTGNTLLTITVTDADANFDSMTADSIFASATSTTSGTAEATATLSEVGGSNSGTFTGTIALSTSVTSGNNLQFTSGDAINLCYNPDQHSLGCVQTLSASEGDSFGFPRAKVTFAGLAGSNSVTLNELRPIPGSVDLCPVTVVNYPVEVAITGAGNADTVPMTVTLSYANGLLGGASESDLVMGYFVSVGDAVGTFTEALHGLVVDTSTKTVTVTKNSTTFSPAQSGHYFVGFTGGCAGGGGGGLVRPGLVVNALAGLAVGSGGGGAGPPGPTITLYALALNDNAVETISMPQEIRDIVLAHDPLTPLEPITTVFEDYELPLSINENGYALGDYENTLVTQTIEPGEPTEFNLVFYTTSEIAHTSLNFNLGPTRTIGGSDTQVLLYKDEPAEIVDPNGNIASATGSINNEGDLKRVVTFSITFSEDIQWSNSDLVIRSWNDNLSSGDTIVYDAIKVVQGSGILDTEDEVVVTTSEETESQSLSLAREELNESEAIPAWIKTSAGWWSEKRINDSDFVLGIEFLVQNDIIKVPTTESETSSSQQIPDWISINAGWWANDQISDKEFTQSLQWLISNGLMTI